ncbi:MAG: MarR family winged helix-turn-helix transcriptional regulator [Turicibacter sp.]
MKLYESESIGRYVSHFHRNGVRYLTEKYEKYGIGFGQYQFLIQLYLKDGLSHEELTELISVDKATTTRAIKKLQELGYVDILLNQKDKRKYCIYLTEKATVIKDEFLDISQTRENELVGSLSKEELNTLYDLLRKVARHNPGYFYEEIENNT